MTPQDDEVSAKSDEKEEETKFKVKSRALEAKPGLRFDKISELLEEVEGPYHR